MTISIQLKPDMHQQQINSQDQRQIRRRVKKKRVTTIIASQFSGNNFN
jgi:hypothetical protein